MYCTTIFEFLVYLKQKSFADAEQDKLDENIRKQKR